MFARVVHTLSMDQNKMNFDTYMFIIDLDEHGNNIVSWMIAMFVLS